MTPAWAQRREELLRDCHRFPRRVHIRWWTVWASSWCPINTRWRPRPANATCTSTSRGCCPTCPARMPRTSRRSSMSNARSCKTFIGTAPWDHRPLIEVLVGQVVDRLGEPDGIIAFDPSSFPKRGTHSVGVKRQWCGHRGKVDNCQVGVFMGYVCDHDHAVLDFRLSLPEEWARDAQRRQECHVPKEVRYHTRQEQLRLSRFMVYWASHQGGTTSWHMYSSPTCRTARWSSWI